MMVVPAPLAIVPFPDCAATECSGKLKTETNTPVRSSAATLPQITCLFIFDIFAPVSKLICGCVYKRPARFTRQPGSGVFHHSSLASRPPTLLARRCRIDLLQR